MKTKELTTLEDFENIKKWDFLACEFHRNIPFYRTRFRVFEVFQNKEVHNEIILERKNNIYFNFKMFIDWGSNLKSAMLISE